MASSFKNRASLAALRKARYLVRKRVEAARKKHGIWHDGEHKLHEEKHGIWQEREHELHDEEQDDAHTSEKIIVFLVAIQSQLADEFFGKLEA